MAKQQKEFDLGGYNTVPERIVEFREKYPHGALQPVNLERPYWIELIGESTFIVYAAAAYRTVGDALPGIGLAWEPFPGKTPYTKDSELQNAETSAWGRAIVAVLAADMRKGIATAEDVSRRAAEHVLPQGWRSQGEMIQAHDAVSRMIKELPDDIDREQFQDHRSTHGWPMTADALKVLEGIVADAETEWQLRQDEDVAEQPATVGAEYVQGEEPF
jgi:hypothetical protein